MLTVCDDGKLDGEVVRIRDHRFIIGRTEGDLKIPIDGRISSRHVEITLQTLGGVHRWVVTDLQSTHGMFVRVSRTILADRAEFLVGNGRYRFDSPQDPPTRRPTSSPARRSPARRMAGTAARARSVPRPSPSWSATRSATGCSWSSPSTGSAPTRPARSAAPMTPSANPGHVRLFRAPNGSWYAEHNRTQNGLWLRMSQIVVDSVVRFQIGEQRFLLSVRIRFVRCVGSVQPTN